MFHKKEKCVPGVDACTLYNASLPAYSLPPACQEGWTRYKENCYKLTRTTLYYGAAKAACVADKATLTSIRDQEENDFVKELAG